jgi:hypothetical protein
VESIRPVMLSGALLLGRLRDRRIRTDQSVSFLAVSSFNAFYGLTADG